MQSHFLMEMDSFRPAINEWKLDSTNPDLIDPLTRREAISFGKDANNHNGGTIAFGPDGYQQPAGSMIARSSPPMERRNASAAAHRMPMRCAPHLPIGCFQDFGDHASPLRLRAAD